LFVVDVPGAYDVTLTLNAGTTDESSTTATLAVGNAAPVASNDLFSLSLASSSALSGSVLAGEQQDYDPEGDPLTFSVATGGQPTNGTVSVAADGTFAYRYSGDPASPPASDQFRYRVTDGFGGTAEAKATILLHGEPEATRPTAPLDFSALDASTAAGSASTFEVSLRWSAASDDVQVVGYNVYRDGELLGSIMSSAAAGSPIAYTDAAVAPNTSYIYHVTALDATSESGLSSPAALRVTTSLRQNIQTGWGDGTATLWAASRCVGCHRGAPGGLTLFGPADSVYAELTEDQGTAPPLRLNTSASAKSLLLCKPLLVTDPRGCRHGGGDFFARATPAYRMLMRWIEDGAPNN